jgi:Asp-tRNA(Asn)/Glu-tRNA(Gln) amidotransferase A subunit family amidase/enoyl-CoA hydratase/carnithine racemase
LPDGDPIFWPLAALIGAYRSGELSPVAVVEEALRRIDRLDGALHSYVTVTPELARAQAAEAERRYREADGELPPLLGVPVSIKDLFDVRGEPTSLGSLVYRGHIAGEDSEPVARLRRAGAVFLGKTNTAEFGQSATTDNLLGAPCTNPWDPGLTAGGSSGGAAASVGAGFASVALGSDGGGSIRIPAAFCGLVGVKPTLAEPADDGSFRAMTDFVCAGPIARTVADARLFLAALLERALPPSVPSGLRIAWCPAPEGRPVDPRVRAKTAAAVERLRALGHDVERVVLPIEGWMDAFGPLVLADEWRYRRHLLDEHADGLLTEYARRTIEAAKDVSDESIADARAMKADVRRRVAEMFERYDAIVTPTTASPPFPAADRPSEVDGQHVGALWGPFPFTAPFNVSGSPAASLPVGLHEGLPIGLQVVGPHHGEAVILDLCEQLEAAIAFPVEELERRWRLKPAAGRANQTAQGTADGVSVEVAGGVAVVRLSRPSKRNAMTRAMLVELQDALRHGVEAGASAAILTGDSSTFSAGMDLDEIGHGSEDSAVDELIAQTGDAIRGLPIPVIAAIEGPCFGAAADLALACDVRVMGAGARFAIPAVKLGILYRPDGIADMLATVGRQTVSRLLLFGERLTANDAVAAGLAARTAPEGRALEVALALAKGAVGVSPEALAATKAVITDIVGRHPDLEAWQGPRHELLRSEHRASSLGAAKSALGAAGNEQAG